MPALHSEALVHGRDAGCVVLLWRGGGDDGGLAVGCAAAEEREALLDAGGQVADERRGDS